MKTISRAEFDGSTEQLRARVQAFRDALTAHATSVGVPGPRETDLVESLASMDDAEFAVEALPTPPEPPAPPTFEQIQQSAVRALNAKFEACANAVTGSYPPSERLTWPIQEQEALQWQASANAPTPFLDAISAARGMKPADLRTRCLAKVTAFRAFSAALVGIRQAYEGAILAVDDAGKVPSALATGTEAFDTLMASLA